MISNPKYNKIFAFNI